MGFEYSFEVGEVYPHFNMLPEEMQTSIERNIVVVIHDSFVIPADEDYLMARLLAQKGLHRNFFWAASQALEKYFKAYLLMHDISVKDLSRGHPLVGLFNAASAFNSDISNFSLALHQDIKIDPELATHVKAFSVDEYVQDLSVHGAAANRYNASGVNFNTGHLFALDAFVYQLRKIIGVVEIADSFGRISKDLIKNFYDNNYGFAPTQATHSGVPSPDFPIKHSLSVTQLDYLTKNKNHQVYSVVLLWLNQKMKL
jgi:hypothetical protein